MYRPRRKIWLTLCFCRLRTICAIFRLTERWHGSPGRWTARYLVRITYVFCLCRWFWCPQSNRLPVRNIERGFWASQRYWARNTIFSDVNKKHSFNMVRTGTSLSMGLLSLSSDSKSGSTSATWCSVPVYWNMSNAHSASLEHHGASLAIFTGMSRLYRSASSPVRIARPFSSR